MLNFEPPYITALTFCILIFVACSSFSTMCRCAWTGTKGTAAAFCTFFTSLVGIFSMLVLMQQAQIYLSWSN